MTEANMTDDVVEKIIRAAIPSADDAVCEHILWGRTPFPFARLDARAIYRAASGFARAGAKGVTLCDHCERTALPGRFECERCYSLLMRSINK